MVLAVTLHNIPEGMAVGVLYASWLQGNSLVSFTAALSLAIGIAIQNFPEGAIISMPLKSTGKSKIKSFIYGVLSGVVEPIGAIITMLLINLVIGSVPYFLAFAAGAMIYVVGKELLPEINEGGFSIYGKIGTVIGFLIMMLMDILL